MSDWNAEAVRHALTVARSHGFTEVELQSDGTSFQARLAPSIKPSTPSTAAETVLAELPETPRKRSITAPLVGYYKQSMLVEGQKINVGDIVATITALGLANDVEATIQGQITKVCVQDGQSVEYGQVLAEVELAEGQ